MKRYFKHHKTVFKILKQLIGIEEVSKDFLINLEVKDEVEKLAYQLNEEAERTERPIWRLSRKVGGRPQCDKCGYRVRIAHSIVSRLWRQFQTTGTAIRGSVVVVHEEPHPQMTGTLSYRPEETGGRQREKSLDTRHGDWTTDITFYRGQKTARWWSVARRPVRCVPLTPTHRRRRSLWCREHRN
ncbi:transposable element Tcb1 transposase [Trichonephila clavipes]|nr:transposable element Tcb1 transposase [Trichonephila clavipes]